MKDDYGNEFEVKVEKKGNEIIRTETYTLEEGKTTLRGEYPKFKGDKDCAFPERLCCNHGIGFERCKYMKCLDIGNWICAFKE